jgi:short-subunit dehydrogenase
MNVLLTGSTGGIGQAIARELKRQDYDVLLQGRDTNKLNALRLELQGGISRIATCTADINKPGERLALIEQARHFGVDTVINNAGINDFRYFADTDVTRIMQTNVISTMELTQALLPILLSQPQPRVLNIGSAFGAIGFPGYVAYCASKHAIKGFSEALRREYADTPLEVLYVAPRATDTNMNSAIVNQLNHDLRVHSDTPEVVARAVLDSLNHARARCAMGLTERLQCKLNGLLPAVVDRAIKTQLPVIKQFLDLVKEESHEKNIANTSA